MVISASRRTDIPAFYSEWLMNRLRAGFCLVPNPMNAKQVSRVSLRPADVDVIVFWTKDPRPLLRHLDEIDAMGYRYYFQFTLNGYPRGLEPRAPASADALDAFSRLSARVGPERCLWRYDPIVLTSLTDVHYHERSLQHFVPRLSDLTRRLTVSVVNFYRKSGNRLRQLASQDIELAPESEKLETYFPVLRLAAGLARAHGIDIVSCAESPVLADLGIRPGKCIDDAVIGGVCGVPVSAKKDPAPARRVWLHTQPRYRHIRYLSAWLLVLLCNGKSTVCREAARSAFSRFAVPGGVP